MIFSTGPQCLLIKLNYPLRQELGAVQGSSGRDSVSKQTLSLSGIAFISETIRQGMHPLQKEHVLADK